MAATAAVIGYNSKIEVETAAGAGTYLELAEVKSITPPNEDVAEQDATHMKSPNKTREFVSGLKDPGSMQVSMNFVPGSATDAFIVAWRAGGESRSVRITAPNGTTTWVFPAFVKSYETPLENESVLQATLGLRITGAVTRT